MATNRANYSNKHYVQEQEAAVERLATTLQTRQSFFHRLTAFKTRLLRATDAMRTNIRTFESMLAAFSGKISNKTSAKFPTQVTLWPAEMQRNGSSY